MAHLKATLSFARKLAETGVLKGLIKLKRFLKFFFQKFIIKLQVAVVKH